MRVRALDPDLLHPPHTQRQRRVLEEATAPVDQSTQGEAEQNHLTTGEEQMDEG